MKRALWFSMLVACGGAQMSRGPVASTSIPAPDPHDEVDQDPGHDEPNDDDTGGESTEPTEPSEPRVPRTPARAARPREPNVSPGAPVLETLEGRVSYYSDRLAGRSTASGEPYRLEEFTAASRDLPFGTLVRVVRLSRAGDEELGSVVVRVNDRGPFGDHRRILDLSRAAAEALDMVRAGVVPVRAEILRRGR